MYPRTDRQYWCRHNRSQVAFYAVIKSREIATCFGYFFYSFFHTLTDIMRASVDLSDLHLSFDNDESSLTPPVRVRHITSFHHQLNSIITSICPTSETAAWIACNSDRVVALYQTDGRETKRIKTNFYIDDMKLTKLGNLLITPDLGTSVKFLDSQSNSPIDFVNVAPFVTRGLFITDKQEVIVGMRDNDSAKVVKMSDSGVRLRELQRDRATNCIYTDPDRIVENSHGDIIVLDWDLKCIISIDMYGRYRFKYDGTIKNIIKCEKFTPSDIVSDRYDNILICDCENNKIHMLNRHGIFLRFLITEENGVCNPCTLALDKAGHLWVGQINGQIHILKYYNCTI